jgi:hypothetical protein
MDLLVPSSSFFLRLSFLTLGKVNIGEGERKKKKISMGLVGYEFRNRSRFFGCVEP